MKLSKKFKNILLYISMLSIIVVTTSGCVYLNNKGWDDMTSEEQEEVKQAYEDAKNDLEEEFSGDEPENEFVKEFINKAEQKIDYKD